MKSGRKFQYIEPLARLYPPSQPCGCDICLSYCRNRPGWWTVKEAARALKAGFAPRMMLEMAPEMTFGVLSPAFKGCESDFARNEFSRAGCIFLLQNNYCELHSTGLQPLECRYCHHERTGYGKVCHADLEKDWHSRDGYSLVVAWGDLVGLWKKYNIQVERKRK